MTADGPLRAESGAGLPPNLPAPGCLFAGSRPRPKDTAVTDKTETAVDRIPLTHSVHYVARGLPDLPYQHGPGVLRPSEITLTYRAAPDSQLGRVHAYVAGRIHVDGQEIPHAPYGQHYDDGLDGWPAWLAEEARLHDPDAAAVVPAGQAPDTGRDALRERIRRAVCEAEGFAWDSDMLEPDEYGDHADMVLSALIGSDTDLRQAIDHRDYWHGEAMSATTRIIELERKLAAAERTRENADFHLGQEMARRQLAEKETDSLRAELSRMAAAPAVVSAVPGQTDDETQATPCDQPNACDPDTGELCATHEEEKAHADGEHEYCGVTCEVAMPTELMRNSLIAWAPPGGKGILAELERRAAAEQPAAGAQQPKEA